MGWALTLYLTLPLLVGFAAGYLWRGVEVRRKVAKRARRNR